MKKLMLSLAVAAFAVGAAAETPAAADGAAPKCGKCGRAVPRKCEDCGQPMMPPRRGGEEKKSAGNEAKRDMRREMTPEMKAAFEEMARERAAIAELAKNYKENNSDENLAKLKTAVAASVDKRIAFMEKRGAETKAELAKIETELAKAEGAEKDKLLERKNAIGKYLERENKRFEEMSKDKGKAVDMMVERVLSDKKAPREGAKPQRRGEKRSGVAEEKK